MFFQVDLCVPNKQPQQNRARVLDHNKSVSSLMFAEIIISTY